MSRTLLRWLPVASVVALTLLSPAARAQTPAQLWDDFNHYVRIARPDLAQTAGESLLQAVDGDKLLDVIEASQYEDYADKTLVRAMKTETLKPTAEKLIASIQAARIKRSREPERLFNDVRLMAENDRARRLALERLKAAGQFATPVLLRVLENEQQKDLHPYAVAAMVGLGQDAVYPLAEALPQLSPRVQTQVAQVLLEIGYPRVLPYMKQVLESSEVDPSARAAVQLTYSQILKTTQFSQDVSASELYLELARQVYTAHTAGRKVAGFDELTQQGVLWAYSPQTGLVPSNVPAVAYGDIRAMIYAARALALNNQLADAHSLWLAANLRRENRLGETPDPSYRSTHEPAYHLRLAGPERQRDVLARALADADPELARDAIHGLDATAGTAIMGNVEPLLQALSYPDRRVRFEAAFALTNPRPQNPFSSSFRVVPVLAEALRQTGVKSAVVIGRDEESANKLAAIATEMGYAPLRGLSLKDVSDLVAAGSGADLIILDLDSAGVIKVIEESRTDYLLAAVPVVARVTRAEAIELRRRYEDMRRLFAYTVALEADALKPGIEAAVATYAGKPITPEDATAYALRAVAMLRDVALSQGKVLNVMDAKAAMIGALKDKRDDLVVRTADVLSLLDDADAQRAIAEEAVDPARLSEVRVALLDSLGLSIKAYGSQLTQAQIEKIVELVKTSEGALALAAARVHGAIMPPTQQVVDMIISTK